MFFMIFFDNVRQSVATVMVESTFVWHAPYTGDIFRRADCSAVVPCLLSQAVCVCHRHLRQKLEATFSFE